MADYRELGTTGLRRSGGYVDDEFLAALKGKTAAKTLREMIDNDPIVGGMLFAIERLIMRVDWRVDPYSEPDGEPTDEDIANAQFVDQCRNDMADSWPEVIQSMLTFLPYGFSLHEIVYKKRGGPSSKNPKRRSMYDDGKIGWRKMPIRSQDTILQWVFEEDSGEVVAAEQYDPYTGRRAVIPLDRAVLLRTTSNKGNPEGRSILRNAYRPWFMKRRIEEIEAVGIERDLAGLPLAYAPGDWFSSDASTGMQAALSRITEIVQGVKRNEAEGVVLPSLYDDNGNRLIELTLLSTGGDRQFNTDQVVTRYDQRIAMTVLADFLLLGHENVGSFALGVEKVDLFTSAIAGWVGTIVAAFNQHAIPRLMAVNGLDPGRSPQLGIGDVEHIDLGSVADYVSKLIGAGVMLGDHDLEDHLRKIGGLPPVDPEAREEADEAAAAQAEAAQAGMEAMAAGATAATPGAEPADEKEPDEKGPVEKYAPGQARDDRGRFASGMGGGIGGSQLRVTSGIRAPGKTLGETTAIEREAFDRAKAGDIDGAVELYEAIGTDPALAREMADLIHNPTLSPAVSGDAWENLRQPDGGFTISTETGAQPPEGYAVAIEGHSSVTPVDAFFEGPPGQERGRRIIKDWLQENAAVFDENPAMHVGGWNDPENKVVVLDPAEVFPPSQRAQAVQAGRDRNQVSIADLERIAAEDWDNAIIKTGGDGGYAGQG